MKPNKNNKESITRITSLFPFLERFKDKAIKKGHTRRSFAGHRELMKLGPHLLCDLGYNRAGYPLKNKKPVNGSYA